MAHSNPPPNHLRHPRPPMTRDQVLEARPLPWLGPESADSALDRTRTRMQVAGVWSDNQVLGSRSTIGCVSLEVTQRCNLDCTLCYLSESSEATKDVPIAEIFRRIDQIKYQFGPGTDVQISGGDPTLRDRKELVAITRRIREIGLRPTLMTNGIAASRELITELVEAGLNDLAFHVDLTEERKGYPTEVSLNKVRAEYIERVRGLPLAIIFNTTVYAGNFHEIPDLVRFFRANADVVGMASFQLQADTGRGELRQRDQVISLETVWQQIEKGAEISVSHESVRIGHPRCHRYGLTMEANGKLYNFFDDAGFFAQLVKATKDLNLDRTRPWKVMVGAIAWLLRHPEFWIPGVSFLTRKLFEMRGDFVRARGKVHKLTFFAQNFMDASGLEQERVHACSFMVMTGEGPISMCMHNAKRDDFILKPVAVPGKEGMVWDPMTGRESAKSVHS